MKRIACGNSVCVVVLVLLALLDPLGQRAHAADVEGAADVPGLARFPHADIVRFMRYPAGGSFAFPLSDVDKIRGELRGRRLLRLAGARTSITYRILAGYTAEEVMAFYERQFSYRGPDRYSCRGLGCGPSTLWANDVFGIATLFGTETSQAYVATIAKLTDGPARVALYVVERANRQVFAQVEVIGEQAGGLPATAQTDASAVNGGARWRALPLRVNATSAAVDIDAANVKQARVVLRDARATEALVVCYLDAPLPAAALVTNSVRCAAQAVDVLQGLLPGVRFLPVGAGGDGRPARVELVYRQSAN